MGNCLRCRESDARAGSGEHDESDRTDGRRSHIGGYIEDDPILYLTPGISRPMSQLTEEEQVKIATRMGLIATLPLVRFDEDKREKWSECIICMCDYEENEELRYLPCLHTYHRTCIDDWLMRSLTCPSCLEELQPVSPRVNRSADSSHPCIRNSSQSTGNESVGTCTTELASCTAATATTYNPRLSAKRGDSASTTAREPTVRLASDAQPDSSVCQSTLKSVTSADRSLSNNNRSDRGDCSNLITCSSTYIRPNLRHHRRTRSNGHVSPLTDSSVFSVQRLERYRRGNSVIDINPVQSSALFDPDLVTEQNQSTVHVSSPTSRFISSPRQLDGDSHETHLG